MVAGCDDYLLHYAQEIGVTRYGHVQRVRTSIGLEWQYHSTSTSRSTPHSAPTPSASACVARMRLIEAYAAVVAEQGGEE
jgi:hypothetical protein